MLLLEQITNAGWLTTGGVAAIGVAIGNMLKSSGIKEYIAYRREKNTAQINALKSKIEYRDKVIESKKIRIKELEKEIELVEKKTDTLRTEAKMQQTHMLNEFNLYKMKLQTVIKTANNFTTDPDVRKILSQLIDTLGINVTPSKT